MAKKKKAGTVGKKGADGTWITCASYDLQVGTGADFEFRFAAVDTSKKKHILDLDKESDHPELARDLFDALQIWPKVGIRFQSEKVTGAAIPQITKIERVH
jgi:hypothetical protein